VSSDLHRPRIWARAFPARARPLIILFLAVGGAAVIWAAKSHPTVDGGDTAVSSQSKRPRGLFYPTSAQWATLTVEPAQQRVFRSEHVTEGKIAVDEDRSTPIFSPYAGRVTKLFVKPGDIVAVGQPLFTVEAADMVQAQNDFITASTALNKAHSALNLARIVDTRQRLLFEGKAAPLKEVQNARAALDAAENDVRSSEVALEAARNRLRILGKTDDEIAQFQDKGVISPETPIYSPIAGTVVSRKIGPGQYVNTGANSAGANETPFIIGDLSTVWLYAYVRETDAPKVQVGQPLNFTLLAYPDQMFEAKVNYVASALDANTRRLTVRATIENPQALFKPEMFASVNIFTGEERNSAAVPRDSLIYEGATVRVWVAREDKSIESRQVRLGLASGRMVQVLDGLQAGERVITKGSLFLDRAAAGS